MTSFIIVDDEPLALEMFAELLDWNEYGYTLLGCAANGVAALKLMKEKKPDIVFTDIRMPSMDGLELCRRVRESYPDVKLVILTAYRDFEYAKKALSCGVTEYLLKNQVEKEVVLPLLERLVIEIEEQRRRQGISRSHYYQSLMLNMPPEEEPCVQWEYRQCCRILLKCRSPYILEELTDCYTKDISLSYKEIENLLPSEGSLGLLQLFWIDSKSWGILVCEKEKEFFSLTENRNSLQEFFKRIQCYFEEKHNVQVIALFDVGAIKPDVLKSVFHEMLNFSGNSLFMNNSEILPYTQMKNSCQCTDIDYKVMRETIKDISKAVHGGERTQLCDSLDFLKKQFTSPYYDLEKYRYICKHLFYQLDQLRNENALITLKEYVIQQKTTLSELVTAEQVWKWIANEFMELTSMTTNVGQKVNNRKIAQSLQYIHEFYQKKLTAKHVAEQIGFSEVYFSNLFKKELGMTFGDYLTTYRINVAKYLILNGDYKVYEIADMAGYTSPQYFSQLFQKETGCTPMEYMVHMGERK